MYVRLAELLLILILFLLFFGSGKLPKVMGELGRGIRTLRKGLDSNNDSHSQEYDKDDKSYIKDHQKKTKKIKDVEIIENIIKTPQSNNNKNTLSSQSSQNSIKKNNTLIKQNHKTVKNNTKTKGVRIRSTDNMIDGDMKDISKVDNNRNKVLHKNKKL